MKEFTYRRADDAHTAVTLVASDPHSAFLAGGTNLVDHLKLGIVSPTALVDIGRLPLDGITDLDDGGVRIGANVRNSDFAAEPRVRRGWPMITRALLSGASGQIRNQATTGGNLLQRTRCVYFQNASSSCNKREPSTGCSAIEGYGRYNAVLGTSEHCVATHPSDLAVALVAADAVVVVLGSDGERRIPVHDLHRLPGDAPDRDTTLDHGDLIVAVELPAHPTCRASTYRKSRDRASYAFALVSVAAALDMADGRIADVRIAWGGVAHRPWRARTAEEQLRGQPYSNAAVREAVDAELASAVTSEQTAFKIPLTRNLTAATLAELAERHRP